MSRNRSWLWFIFQRIWIAVVNTWKLFIELPPGELSLVWGWAQHSFEVNQSSQRCLCIMSSFRLLALICHWDISEVIFDYLTIKLFDRETSKSRRQGVVESQTCVSCRLLSLFCSEWYVKRYFLAFTAVCGKLYQWMYLDRFLLNYWFMEQFSRFACY